MSWLRDVKQAREGAIMATQEQRHSAEIDDCRVTSDPSDRDSRPGAIDPSPYRPSVLFRHAMKGSVQRLSSAVTAPAARPDSPAMAREAPGLWSLMGASLAVGAAAGFLELTMLAIRLHVLHQAGLSTLRISRHVAWMMPVAETLVVSGLALLFVTPVLVWSARRAGRRPFARPVAWTWDWAGAVLGTLLLLGPLLAIPKLHAVAALTVAIGAGTRIRRLLVRPTPGWRRTACWAGAIVLGGLAVYSFWQWASVARALERAWSRPASSAPNLLWIVMDTVRADRMSLYGYGRPTTPQLAEWAKEGITFERARSAAPWTLPSHITMFTGLWPFEHGARVDRSYFGASPTVAEQLAARGYTTAGLAANTQVCNASYGVGRGFDYYIELLGNHEVSLRATMFNSALSARIMHLARWMGLPVPDQFLNARRRLAPQLIAHAQEWLHGVRRRNEDGPPGSHRPFFLFMNFLDVHSPYLPLPGTKRLFWTEPVPRPGLALPENGWLALQARDAAPADRRAEFQRELDQVNRRLSDLYDDCLRGLDAQLGSFLGSLRAAGLLEDTWVVITSDHGEHFGEHDQYGHGTSLYNPLTHVPLILIPPLRAAGSAADPFAALRGRRIGAPVSHRDLAVTLTGLLLPGADNPFPGRSLARHWGPDGPAAPDPILAQMEVQQLGGQEVQAERVLKLDSVIDEDHLLIVSSRNETELYRLLDDPENRRNLAGQPTQHARVERLRRTLDVLRQPPRRP
jgi:arylsulfatase A-like enzyme